MWIVSTSGSNTRDTTTVAISPRWTSHLSIARLAPSRAACPEWLVMSTSLPVRRARRRPDRG